VTRLTELTDSEKETLHLIMFNYTNKEIASELGISIHTVVARVSVIGYKLGILNRRIPGDKLKPRIREMVNLERIK